MKSVSVLDGMYHDNNNNTNTNNNSSNNIHLTSNIQCL